jgi:hypothetical protein
MNSFEVRFECPIVYTRADLDICIVLTQDTRESVTDPFRFEDDSDSRIK